MGKYKGVVLFDYDFTTVDRDDGILVASQKTIESLNKLKENGYLTMLCSRAEANVFWKMILTSSRGRSPVMELTQRLRDVRFVISISRRM